MPTYTYECKQHGLFERLTTMKEHKRIRPCPICLQDSEQVILDAPGVVFKGKGWCRPTPKIPEKFLKMSEAELNSDLGLAPDA